MGTRSLTIVRDDQGRDLVTLYRQMDGYLEGHGEELATFLQGFQVVNGITSYGPKLKLANGAGCLAAQLVANFKKGHKKTKDFPASGPIGNFYIEPAGTRNVGEEYVYIVNVTDAHEIHIRVLDGNREPLFQGTAAQLLEHISKVKV